MSNPAKQPRATIADLLAIPEDRRRHEIIDGVLAEKEAASGRHGAAQGRLARRLGPYDRRPGGRWPGGWWFATEVEIQLAESQIVRPDLAGWRRERLDVLPSEVPITVTPDWICEILSTNPSGKSPNGSRVPPRSAGGDREAGGVAEGGWHSENKRNDLIKKKRAYHLHQVRHYWLVDPVDETLAVYRWQADGYVEVLIAERAEVVRAEPFDAIELRVGVLFGDDDPEA